MAMLEDITRNLPSLQFDLSLQDDEKELLHLRVRSHAVVSTACAQATYFVTILNEVKEKIFENTKPHSKSSSYKPLKVGIIGCGRLGKQLATVLLEFGKVDPSNLYISTRCPENIEQFDSKGVTCCFDNKMVASMVDILFLSCLPSQLHTVSQDLRGNLNCLVYSFIGGMSLAKISQLLDYQQIIKPNFIFRSDIDEKSDSGPWQFGRNISEVLHDEVCCAQTCPLNSNKESVLEEQKKLCEVFVFALLNQCTAHGVSKNEALRHCNSIMFGLKPDHVSCLIVEDILEETQSQESLENNNLFPHFDLVKLSLDQTLLGKKFCDGNEVLREGFTSKYRQVFEKIPATVEHPSLMY